MSDWVDRHLDKAFASLDDVPVRELVATSRKNGLRDFASMFRAAGARASPASTGGRPSPAAQMSCPNRSPAPRRPLGDRLFRQARSEFLAAQPALQKVVGGPEGGFAEELSKISDRLRAAVFEVDQGLDANADMVTALKSGNWSRASEFAAKGETDFRQAAQGLEAIPDPEDEDVQKFVRQTTEGYRLTAQRGERLRPRNLQLATLPRCERATRRLGECSQRPPAAPRATPVLQAAPGCGPTPLIGETRGASVSCAD